MRAALLVLVAACASPTSQAPLANTKPTPAATGPAPRVVRGGTYGLTTEHIPAISPDGTFIVAAFRESDGERGLPNLTLVVKNRDDVEVVRHVVLSLGEADQFLDDAAGKNPALDARVTRANAWLETLHAGAMRVLSPEPQTHKLDRQNVVGDGFIVVWTSSHLQIADGEHVVVDRDTPASWLAESSSVNVCKSSSYLGAGAIDRAHRLVVVTISYVADSGFCAPPPDQHHVITW